MKADERESCRCYPDVALSLKRVCPSNRFFSPPRSSIKSQLDPERTQTLGSPIDLFSRSRCAPPRRWERSTSPESVAGPPANSIRAGCGYTDHVVKPAEVRRNDVVGQAATIPYERCHSQARVVADPTKNHRRSQRSWHPTEGQRAARIAYESYKTSFVIRNNFDSFLIQPVYCTYLIPLPDKPFPTCEESRDHVSSANWKGTLVCPSLLARIVFSSVLCILSTAQGSMCELLFGKDQRDANWPFTSSHKDVAVPIQNRPLSHVARSGMTTRRSPFLAPNDAAPHSTPRSPSKSRAEHERTQTKDRRTNSLSTHCCTPHSRRGTTESPSLGQSTAASVTPSAVARLPRACHTP
jgi:hypothetical protein